MTFAYSAGTITQTGTDTDLSGLSGLTGVTHHNYAYEDIYEINSATELVINGTLTMDPEFETLICSRTPGTNNNAIWINGTFNIGSTDTENSYLRHAFGTAIIFNNTSTNNAFNWTETWANLYVDTDGTLNWYGGTIFQTGCTAVYGAFNTYSPQCIMHCRDKINATEEPQIRQRSTTMAVDGLTTVDVKLTMIANPSQLDRYNPIHSPSCLDFSSSTPANTWITLYDLVTGQGNEKEVGMKNDAWLRTINTSDGSDLIMTAQNGSSGTDQEGLAEFRHEVRVTVTELDGTAISGVRMYARDVTDVNRPSANTWGTNPDYTADRSYDTTSNVSGLASFTGDTGAVLIATRHRISTTAGNTNVYSPRGKANDTTDLWDFGFAGYGFLPGVQEYEMKGTGGVVATYVLFADTGITETTAATVAAYTDLTDGNRLYDRAQYWLQADKDNMEEVGLGNALVVKNGKAIDFGVYDLVIDSGAASAFAVTTATNVVTIDPGTGAFATTANWNEIDAPEITINSVTNVDDWTFTGTVYLNVDQDLTDVTINGDLRVNIAANTTLDFSGVTVTGNVYNDATGNTLQINATNSSMTAGDAGTGNGQTNIQNTVPIKVTVKDANDGTALIGARVFLEAGSGGPLAAGTDIVNELTDVNGEVNDTFNYSSDQPIVGKVRKATP